jgi:hypothetical protein
MDVQGGAPAAIASSCNWTEAGAYDSHENTPIVCECERRQF